MSSSLTTPAFVMTGPWSEETRKNPATKYVEIHAKEFYDSGAHGNMADYTTDDYSMTTPHGDHHNSRRENTFAGPIDKFCMAPYSEFFHEPYHMIATELQDGRDLYIQCYIFANVV